MEEITFKTANEKTVDNLKQHYVDERPIMFENVCYKIAQIVVDVELEFEPNPVNPYTVTMYVYPTGNSTEKTEFVKNDHKELLGKVSPKFLNHKGKRLAGLYELLDDIKDQIREVEEG